MPHRAPRSTLLWAVVLLAGLLSACASTPPSAAESTKANPADPWEKMNRSTHRFNNAVDRAVLKPVATAYRDYVPEPVRKGVGNVLENLGYPTTIVNQFLQGKLRAGLQDTGRLLLNSTVGVAGVFDVATRAGLDKNDEDFGQTLGRWGVPAGPYLELPLMGPSTVRDTPTRYVDSRTQLDELLEDDVVEEFRDDGYEYARIGLTVLDTRAELLSLDRLRAQAFDEYAFVRDAWLQRREYAVRDGDVEEEALEEFPEDEMPPEEPQAAPDGSEAQAPDEPPEPDAEPSTAPTDADGSGTAPATKSEPDRPR